MNINLLHQDQEAVEISSDEEGGNSYEPKFEIVPEHINAIVRAMKAVQEPFGLIIIQIACFPRAPLIYVAYIRAFHYSVL